MYQGYDLTKINKYSHQKGLGQLKSKNILKQVLEQSLRSPQLEFMNEYVLHNLT